MSSPGAEMVLSSSQIYVTHRMKCIELRLHFISGSLRLPERAKRQLSLCGGTGGLAGRLLYWVAFIARFSCLQLSAQGLGQFGGGTRG